VSEHETISEHDLHSAAGAPAAPDEASATVQALVLAWSRDEPWRIGQSLAIPPGDPGPVVVFGRGDSSPGHPKRVLLAEQRSARAASVPALRNPAISRAQLEIQARGSRELAVRNLGRCKLLHRGAVVAEAAVAPGDTLQLGRQLLFVAVQRPAVMPDTAEGWLAYPEFPCGEVDPLGMVGESAAIWRLRGEIAAAASRPSHVLISGPSGSGKELVAQAIHALSPRGGRPLVARNAATLPEALIDAELFGNARSYPNPGMPERPGLVGEADGSTLFLDELGELPHAAQAHLLRVLDGGEYHRLGDGRARRADVRLIAATNRDVATLKPDLGARLGLRIVVPDLDARREDIPLLIRHLVRRAAARGDVLARSLLPGGDPAAEPSLDVGLCRDLVERRYELNVRELERVLWQRLSPSAHQLQEATRAGAAAGASQRGEPGRAGASGAGAALDPARVQRCLDENNGALEPTRRTLGLKNRFALLRFIKKHGLEIRRRPGDSPGGRLPHGT
jgi:DNA-binding NtrC family response regulator